MKFKPVFSAFSVITIFTVLGILGIAVIPLLPVQLEPSQNAPTISIAFSWPKAPDEMVEREVTGKLEGAVSTVKGIKNIRSVSSTGSGYIQADLDGSINVSQARYEIVTLIRQAYPNLPSGVSFPTVKANKPMDKEHKPVLSYIINGNGSLGAIQQLVETQIRPRLALTKGIYDISVHGAGLYVWKMTYNPTDLNINEVNINDILRAIKDYFKQFALGKAYIYKPNLLNGGEEYCYINLGYALQKTIPWQKIVIKQSNGRIIYLTDLVTIRFSEQAPQSYYRLNGLNTVSIEILGEKNANYIVLAGQVKKQVEQIKKDLPSGYSMLLTADVTVDLRSELTKITWRSLGTLLILMIFILAASRQWRYLLIIFISLVLNLLLAFILYYLFKIEIQRYSIAAITVSMGMIIDNSIVVIDHIRHKRDLRVFLAVAGATSTIIGAVCIIFFLGENQKFKLLDFAWVMIINLVVSLAISLLLIPALMQKIQMPTASGWRGLRRKRRIILYNQLYNLVITAGNRFKPAFIAVYVLAFGLPLFILPEEIKSETTWGRVYNNTIGSTFYVENIRPWADKCLGGTLRIFFSGSSRFSYSDELIERTRLSVDIRMPKGASLEQMNHVVLNFENYLSQYNQLEQFQSRVNSGQSARIDILFKKAYTDGYFPFQLKSELETKSAYTGLAEFTISGVGPGFDNELNTTSTNKALTLLGYNYTELQRLGENVKQLLIDNPRVKKVSVGGERDRRGEKSSLELAFRTTNNDQSLLNNLSALGISNALSDFSAGELNAGNIFYKGRYVPVILQSNQPTASMWQIMNEPVRSDSGAYVRLSEFGAMDKVRVGDQIMRENQQYQLVINYDFIGDPNISSQVSQQIIKQVSADLPLGYTLKEDKYNFWEGSENSLTWAIFVTIGIVFLVCAVLLNSIIQSLAIIGIIPLSFIGVFVTSILFGYKFDEGGYAAFIILSGIVVTAALFILNDYNNLRKDRPQMPLRRLFIKAYNSKIIPVILTRLSMILGLVPFMIFSKNEPFWYALSLSVTGGLVFSMVSVIVFLPLFLKGVGKERSIQHG